MSQNYSQNINSGKKWYQKTVWIIALLILFFPVGLFLMWKYTDWKKPVKWGVTVFILFCFIAGRFSSDNLEKISLQASTNRTYDINEEVDINIATTPADYQLSEDDFECSGGDITISDKNIIFTASTTGSYKIQAEHNRIKSNKLVIKVEDKKAIAEAQAKKEAEEKAAKKAAEEAAAKKATEEEAAKKAAEEAAAKKAAEEEAAKKAAEEAAAKKAAEEEAAKKAAEEAESHQQSQADIGGIVYWTPNGEVYHSTPNCPSLSRSKTIYNGSVAESGKSRPCKNCY